jgi:hypothetical protein
VLTPADLVPCHTSTLTKPLSPCFRAAEIARLNGRRGAAARGSPQRVDRADARTGDRSDRWLAGHLATCDPHVRLVYGLRHLLADAKLSRNSAADSDTFRRTCRNIRHRRWDGDRNIRTRYPHIDLSDPLGRGHRSS